MIESEKVFMEMLFMASNSDNISDNSTFGKNLAELRKTAGFSQRALAEELGISHRMVAYYEAQTDRPPSHLLPDLARILGVSTDQLFGIGKKSRRTPKPLNRSLQQRFAKVSELPSETRRQVIQIIDAFIEREALKSSSMTDHS